MTQKAFATEIGVGQPQLSQIENGTRRLTVDNMMAAQLRFKLPVGFFDADPIEYRTNDLNYRSRKLSRTKQRQADIAFGLTEQAVRSGGRKGGTVPRLDVGTRSPESARPIPENEGLAVQARALIGVRSGKVINNVTACLERLGILVTGLEVPRGCEVIDGISTPHLTDEPFVITLDLEKPGDRMRFSAAHELGHVLLHTGGGTRAPETKEMREIEADQFAAAFLLPRESLLDELAPTLTLAGYARVKARWGVSIQAIIRRSLDLGVINHDRYQSLMIQLSSRGWRKAEPVKIPRERPSIPTPRIFANLSMVDTPEAERDAQQRPSNVIGLFDSP